MFRFLRDIAKTGGGLQQAVGDRRDLSKIRCLEEPELSLHSTIVSKLPALIWRLQRARRRQVILSSHSAELFSDRGIKPTEVALLRPRGSEGTVVELAADKEDVRLLLEGGITMADAVLPLTAPAEVEQLTLFE